MNKTLLLAAILLMVINSFGQRAEVACGSPYPKLNYGYVNYIDNDLGRILKITYKTNLFGKRAKITNIKVVGIVKFSPTNITTSIQADSIVTVIGTSSAVNINLNAVPSTVPASVTANIVSEIANNLSILMVGKTEKAINNISALKDSITKLNLPDLRNQDKVIYAIVNEVQIANKLMIGLKKDNRFSLDLSVDVPKEVSASLKLNVNLACSEISFFKGNDKLAFYNFIPIDYHGKILNDFATLKFQSIAVENTKTDFLMDKNGNIYKKDKNDIMSQKILFVDKLPDEETK